MKINATFFTGYKLFIFLLCAEKSYKMALVLKQRVQFSRLRFLGLSGILLSFILTVSQGMMLPETGTDVILEVMKMLASNQMNATEQLQNGELRV